MIAHCENAGDRMAILDCPPDMLPQDILEWRMNTAGYDSKFAALYYPWIEVMNPLTNQPMLVPPSGHVAGVWCRTDATRGVHKAPANEVAMGVNGLGFQITQAEQGGLNKVGINCIRSFPGRGIRIWGARTLSSDPEWRYINVRRLFNYVAESIMEGTQWSVFEPNDEKLWIQLRIAVSNFLTRTWSEGALFGSTPAEAFFVKCDSETNPPEVIEAGQVICEIGIAPVKPAEFVVFRLSQFSGGDGAVGRVAQPGQLSTERTTGMPANDKEAHVPIWFTLKIGGAEAAGFFKEATGFDSESEVTEIKRSMPNGKTDVIKAMGNTKWGDIELKRGVDQDKTLWNWRKMIVDGQLKDGPQGLHGHDARLRGQARRHLLDPERLAQEVHGRGPEGRLQRGRRRGHHALPRGLRDQVAKA